MATQGALRPALLGAALLLLGGLAPSQKLLFGANDNQDFNNNVSMGGPNLLLGIKFTATASLPVIAAEVFTGEQSGRNSLAIWDHAAATNWPGKELAKGTWTMWRENSWQGAVFNMPVILTQNQDYWLVWGCINSSQSTQANSGAQTFYYRGSFDAGLNWNGPATGWGPTPWKFRLYLPSNPGTFTKVGSGIPGSGSFVPVLDAPGWPVHGNEITLRIIDPAPSAPALLMGGRPTIIPVGPWTVYAFPPLLNIALTTAAGRGAGDGDMPLPLSIPGDPALVGMAISLQSWIVDAAAVGGLAHSNGLTVLIK